MAQLASRNMTVNLDGRDFSLTSDMIRFEKTTKKILEEKYTPHVIEPSYGLGRIMYCIYEHCFKMRENDVQRTYFDFPAAISPVKCSILPLLNDPELNKISQDMSK